MTVLVIADINGNNELQSATLHTITAAKKLGDVEVLVAGEGVNDVAGKIAQIDGVKKVLFSNAAHYKNGLAEELAPLVKSQAESYSHILFSSTAFGKNLAPRVTALLDGAQVTDVTAIQDAQTFQHPIYAGNAFETVQVGNPKIVLTVRGTAFDAANASGGSGATEEIPATPASGKTKFVSVDIQKSERPELTSASVVVSGGRGLASKENFEKIVFPLADKLGAAIGASRAAVDAGYIPNDFQVGQTGKVVAPQLYIALGISGAIQHVAGMQDSKVIVAINKDPDATIFQIADYGLVADVNEAVPELISKL